MVKVSDTCSALPLECGEPFHYFSTDMASQGLFALVVSYFAYNASKYALDKAFSIGLLGKFKKSHPQ
jgi:hypothetical protein|tara:strand:+ start:317 stop:517 length:201 start_codon:yes stop_codon:yes gene_type:complete